MICAPRQTLLLCVAALTANAAASEFKLFPVDPLEGIFAGNSSALLEKGMQKLQYGDIAGAERMLQLGKKNFSAMPQDLLPAFLNFYRGDRAGAERLLRAAAGDEKNPRCFMSRLFLGYCEFAGQRWFAAYNWFAAADKEGAAPQVRLLSRAGTVQSLLYGGAFADAAMLLEDAQKDFPAEQLLWRKMTLALSGLSKNTVDLEQNWNFWKEQFPPQPDELLYSAFCAGAEAAAAENDLKNAEKFYAEAFNFSVNDVHRRNSLRQLIIVQEKLNADRAFRSVDKYLLFFPEAADAGMMRLRQGMILNRKNDLDGALKIFREVLNNRKFNSSERVKAALYAAFACEKMGDISMARELYNSALRRFDHQAEFADQIKMQLLEFLIRTKEYSPAAVLGEELVGSPSVEPDKLRMLRLKALRELKRYAEASSIAVALSSASDPLYAAEGAWQLACLTELQGDVPRARQLYLHFIERFPKEKRVPDAMLAAAEFALQQQDFKAAGSELQRFLELYPGHGARSKAFLGAIYAHLQLPDRDKTKVGSLLEGVKKEFPATTEYDQAVIELGRTYVKENNFTAALGLLEQFLKERSASNHAADALLLAATVFERISNHTKAVEYVDRMLDKFPNSPLAVEAAMLGGSSSFQSGNYKKALAYYERARELGGRGVIAQVAAGEAADCHVQLRTPENIKRAVQIYKQLAESSEFPALQAQALYKLGSALEQLNKKSEALNAYEELLSLAAGSEKMRQSSGVAPWCARSARSALRIILGTPHMPDGSQRAQRVQRLYSLLGLPGSAAELRSYLEEIKNHYNLLD